MTVERIAGLPTAVNENLLYRLPQVLLLGIQCLYILAIPSFLGPKPEAAVPAQPHTGMTIVNESGSDGQKILKAMDLDPGSGTYRED